MSLTETQEGWRIVETQEIAATRAVTSSARAQSRLEELLDNTKPDIPADCRFLDYRLASPFRYPPLEYGSRFGSSYERGIFYGSTELETAFAEASVYLWLFQSGIDDLGPLKQLHAERTAFLFSLHKKMAIDLSHDLSPNELAQVCAAQSWQQSQKTGAAYRQANAAYLLYPSARWQNGSNIAIFSPDAFAHNKPLDSQQWRLQMSNEYCWFSNGTTAYEFWHRDFAMEGLIPHPCL